MRREACGVSYSVRRAVGCTAYCVLCAWPLAAQAVRRAERSAAELAIAGGRLDVAESLLYEAARRAPRDPAARRALGSFLAARGRLKVGAVLLEEARQFGGDARAIDEQLAHIYGWLGAWAPLSALESAEPSRARAVYLARNPSSRTGPDSASVRLDPNELAGLGRIALEVGGVRLTADIDARIEGLVLPSAPAVVARLEVFGKENGGTLAVAPAVTIGAFVLKNVPARIEAVASARVGLDVLAPLAPTFDAARKTLTLHSAPTSRGTGEESQELQMLLGFPGVRIVARAGQSPVALESAAGRAAVRGARWALDLQRGALVVLR